MIYLWRIARLAPKHYGLVPLRCIRRDRIRVETKARSRASSPRKYIDIAVQTRLTNPTRISLNIPSSIFRTRISGNIKLTATTRDPGQVTVLTYSFAENPIRRLRNQIRRPSITIDISISTQNTVNAGNPSARRAHDSPKFIVLTAPPSN